MEKTEQTKRQMRQKAGLDPTRITFINAELIEAQSLYWRYSRAMINAIGEPFTFGIEGRQATQLRLCSLRALHGYAHISRINSTGHSALAFHVPSV